MANKNFDTYDIATQLNLSDTKLIDNKSEAADEDRIQQATYALELAFLLGGGDANTETLTGNKTLTDTSARIQYLDPGGADRDVIAPAEAASNFPFIISNRADADETLAYKDDGGATIDTVAQGETKAFFSDGTNWAALSGGGEGGEVQSYTPTLTNVTLGNGTLVGRYIQIGKLVIGEVELTLGSTSAVTGIVNIEPPVLAESATFVFLHLAQLNMRDDSTSTEYSGTARIGGTDFLLRRQIVSGSDLVTANINATNPFTWAQNDSMGLSFAYIAA